MLLDPARSPLHRGGDSVRSVTAALACCLMSDEKQDQERADRDHARAEEAHWQVAEAGAEEDRRSDNEQDDPEKASGAAGREPRQSKA